MEDPNVTTISLDDEIDEGNGAAPLVSLDDKAAREIPTEVAEKRALRADYGLGPQSPGRDVLTNGITTGQEEALRGTAAQQKAEAEAAARAKTMLGVTAKQSPLTQNDVDLFHGSNKPPIIDPNIIFEKSYADRIVNDLSTGSSDSSSVMNKALSQNPTKTYDQMDVASDIITKQGILEKELEERKSDWKNTSWAAGAVDMAESFVPLLSNIRLHNVAGVDSSLLPGANLEDQVKGLLLNDPSSFKTKLAQISDELYAKNPQDAIKFLEAVKSYGSDDSYLDTLLGVADFAGVVQGIPGAVRGVGRLTGAIKTAGEVLPKTAAADIAERQSAKSLKDAVKASAKHPNNPEDIFEAVGQVDKAADISALRKVGILPTTGMTDAEVLARNLPTAARVQSIVSDAGTLSREASDRLVAKLNRVVVGTEDALGVTVRNTRLEPEQATVALEEAKAALRREFEKTTDSVIDVKTAVNLVEKEITYVNKKEILSRPADNIVDVRHNKIENSLPNTETVTIELGAPNATPFPTDDLAKFYAGEMYGLEEGTYSVKQVGNGFTLEVTRPFDETSGGVRQALDTKNADPSEGIGGFMDYIRQPNKAIPGYFKGADENLSVFQTEQRKAVQFGFNQTLGELKELMQPIASLSNNEKTALEKILKYNRDFFDTKTGDRGFFYETVGQLEEGFQKSNGRLPSQKEIEAYFTYTQLSDIDWGMRNFSLYRDKARLGLKKFNFEFAKHDEGGANFPRTPDFEGKLIDDLPWHGEPASVMHMDAKGRTPTVFNTKEVNPETYREMMKNEGYRVIQVDNPVNRPFTDVLGNREIVQYVLTKEFKESELSLKQLDYNPGGHVEYQHDWFVKQPRISTGRGGQKFYEGDSTVLNFTSQAQTSKFEKAMNTGRTLLKEGKFNELAEHVKKNLPWTNDQFKALFSGEDALDIDQRFHVVKRGRSVIQDEKYIRSDNPGIRDYTDSSHNLSGEANRKFVGARNGPLMTVRASGADSNPILRLAEAKTIDPLQTMGRGLSNAVNNRFFGDYKTGAIEDFISRYADTMKTSARELQNFPMYYLENPEWDMSRANFGKVTEAMAARRAIKNFVGETTTLHRVVENTRQRIYNSIFNTFGEDVTTKVVNKTSPRGTDTIDPAGYFRAIGFHTKLGFWNPVQFPLQAMGATHAIALSPKHGLNAAIAYMPTRMLGLHPSEELISYAAQKMKAFGWNPEHFEESVKTMKQTGWDKVGSEHAWKDNIADAKTFDSEKGSFLDSGSVFFNEGEKVNRIVAWHTSYREWREANPLKNIDSEQIRKILNRADLLGANMTRASAASWQKGAMSVPTQFMGYSARLMDQFLGKRLTMGEKARGFAMYSAMYGAPASVALTGVPMYDSIRKEALERGWNVDNRFFQALNQGIIGTAVSMVTGQEYNVAQRYGPGGLTLLKDVVAGDKSAAELLGGASGSILGDMLSAGSNILKDFYEVNKDGGSYSPTQNDLMDVARNISSVNNAYKLIVAMNTGKYYSKNGTLMGSMTGTDAVVQALTGLAPQSQADSFLRNQSQTDRKEFKETIYKEYSKQMRLGQRAYEDGDKEGAAAFYKKASAARIAGDLNASDNAAMLTRYLKDFTPRELSGVTSFINNAPASQYKARLDQNTRTKE